MDADGTYLGQELSEQLHCWCRSALKATPIFIIIVSERLSSAQCNSSTAGRLDLGWNCPEMIFEMSIRFM